jgi:uncharacterized protein (DUF1501 family)
MSQPSRRELLRAAAGAGLALALPRVTFAQAGTGRRFVFVIQRGAADGLHTVIPTADPGYAALRGALAIPAASAIALDGSFALHPALVEVGRMYTGGHALMAHAVASPYRDRSHFDGQNVLETGGSVPYKQKDGWLNRLLDLLPQPGHEAIAIAPTVPIALRGAAGVTSYAPSAQTPAADDLLQRVRQMYAADPQLQGLWKAAMDARGIAMADGVTQRRVDAAGIGKMAASFLAQPRGPRIAMVESGGWDTHSNQLNLMTAQFRALDGLLAALRDGLGPLWGQTVVLVATEFGRTAAVNGTGGTDHGNGAVAMVLGGAVRGGRVLADWPGLAPGALLDGRDLKPTLALDRLVAGTVAECFGLDPEKVARAVFPEMGRVKPLEGLVALPSAAG